MEIRDSVMSYDSWSDMVLDRQQGESISSHFLQSRMPPDEADVVIVIDNKPWKFFPQADRRYFRFVRFEGPYQGVWTWLQQPTRDVQAEVDNQIEQWERNQRVSVYPEVLPKFEGQDATDGQGLVRSRRLTRNTCPHILCS